MKNFQNRLKEIYTSLSEAVVLAAAGLWLWANRLAGVDPRPALVPIRVVDRGWDRSRRLPH